MDPKVTPFAAVRRRTVFCILVIYLFLHAEIALYGTIDGFLTDGQENHWLAVFLIVSIGLNAMAALFSWMLFFVSVQLLDWVALRRAMTNCNENKAGEKQRHIKLQRCQAIIYMYLCVICTFSFSIWLVLLSDKGSWIFALVCQVVNIAFGPLFTLPFLHRSRGWREGFRSRIPRK
jgi:hypothetical protein